MAADKGHCEVAGCLLQHGIAIDGRSSTKQTPLPYGVSVGYVEMAKILLEAGANTELRTIFAATPLFIAMARGHQLVMGF